MYKFDVTSIRASEPNGFLTTLPDPAWVECPRCAKSARITRKPHIYRMRADAIVTCGHCAFRHEDAELFRANQASARFVSAHRGGCAKCGGASFEGSKARITRHRSRLTLHIRCQGCHHPNTFPATATAAPVREGYDHWFGLPLVLRADYGKRLIWAYNAHHIDLLEGWIEADLRERSLNAHYMTMAARLPRWMKAAHARKPVLRALAKLRDKAKREGLT